MVVYLDLVFVVNCAADALALHITARLSGLAPRLRRIILASFLGGIYGMLCMVPAFSFLANTGLQMITVFLITRLVFGKQKTLLRLFILFYILSCTLGGTMLAISQSVFASGLLKTMNNLDWKVFFLVGCICYFLLSVVFRGSAKHAVAGELCKADVILGEHSVTLDVLFDTGHTLCDPYTGKPVLTAWWKAVERLSSEEERSILNHLESQGCMWCAEKLGTISPGKFRMIPYRAVGISNAMLLGFVADAVIIDGELRGELTVVLSPTPVSDGGGYTALWGGERMGKTQDDASVEICTV